MNIAERNKKVIKYIPFVKKRLMKITNNGTKYKELYDDLFEVGIVGIIDAIDHYEQPKVHKTPFYIYAYRKVMSYMEAELKKDNNILCEDIAIESIADKNSENALTCIIVKDIMERSIKILSEREFYMINAYYIEGYTFMEIGKKLFITRERVRQVFLRGLKKLKNKKEFL